MLGSLQSTFLQNGLQWVLQVPEFVGSLQARNDTVTKNKNEQTKQPKHYLCVCEGPRLEGPLSCLRATRQFPLGNALSPFSMYGVQPRFHCDPALDHGCKSIPALTVTGSRVEYVIQVCLIRPQRSYGEEMAYFRWT